MTKTVPNHELKHSIYILNILIDSVPIYQLTIQATAVSAIQLVDHIQSYFTTLSQPKLFLDHKCTIEVKSNEIVKNGSQMFANMSLQSREKEIKSFIQNNKQAPLVTNSLFRHENNLNNLNRLDVKLQQDMKKVPQIKQQKQSNLNSQIMQPKTKQNKIQGYIEQIHPSPSLQHSNKKIDLSTQQKVIQDLRPQLQSFGQGQLLTFEKTNNNVERVGTSPANGNCCNLI